MGIFPSEMDDELRALRSRLDALADKASRNTSRADATDKKLTAMVTEIGEMMQELRHFTGMVSRLTILTESRSHAHFLAEQLELDFGSYSRARELATAMLRAAGDQELWSETRAEALPILERTALKYWLPGAALAFAAWRGDDRREAERRTREAILLDDDRSSMFFALQSLRYGRPTAEAWLRRYFDAQDPATMDPDAAGLFFSACEGGLGPGCRRAAYQAAEKWAASSAQDGNDGEFATRWEQFLQARAATPDPEAFPLLRKYSPSWKNIEKALEWSALQDGIGSFYRGLADPAAPRELAPAVFDPEHMLEKLMREYQDDEAPLRREYMLSRMAVEENGDMDAAIARLNREWPLKRSGEAFSALLMNIVNGGSAYSPETFRLSLVLSRRWLEPAFERLQAAGKADIPDKVAIVVNGWSGESARGENESDLLASYSRHNHEWESGDKKPLWMEERFILPAIVAIVLILLTLSTVILPLLAIGAFGYYFHSQMKKLEAEREKENQRREEQHKEGMATISACLAEIAAFRRLVAAKTRESEEVRALMQNLSPVPVGLESSLQANAPSWPASPGGAFLPDWDIVPPVLDVKKRLNPGEGA